MEYLHHGEQSNLCLTWPCGTFLLDFKNTDYLEFCPHTSSSFCIDALDVSEENTLAAHSGETLEGETLYRSARMPQDAFDTLLFRHA